MKTIRQFFLAFTLLGFVSLSIQAKPAKVGMQNMVNAYFKTYNGGKTPRLLKKDLRNGYMEYQTMLGNVAIKIPLQFAYYLTAAGQEMLAVSVPNCMQSCFSVFTIFKMQSGQLVEAQNQVQGFANSIKLNEAIARHADNSMTIAEKKRRARGEMAIYDLMINLPQNGTTIYVTKKSNRQANTLATIIAELRYNYQTGKFRLVKIPQKGNATSDYSGTYHFQENKGQTNTMPISYGHTIVIKKENGGYTGSYELSGYQMHANFRCNVEKEGQGLLLRFKSLGDVSMIKGLKVGQKILKLTPQGSKAQVYFTKGYPLKDWVGKTYVAKKTK